MRTRRLEKRCQELISALDIPEPFELTEFCHRLERKLGRAIHLVPITTPSGSPCAMWVRTARTDYIFHDRGISLLHRQHIILHEIGHILFGHKDGPPFAQGLAQLILPDLEAELIESILGRTAYTRQEELEAETFADLTLLVVQRPRYRDAEVALPRSPETAEIICRIEKAVGQHHYIGHSE